MGKTNWIEKLKALIETVDGVVDTLETVVGAINDTTTDSLHGKLGTDTELADNSLYDLLGGLAFKTHSLSTMLGALTSTDNLKGIIGAYTTAANLKAAIDTIEGYVDDLETLVGAINDTTTDTLHGKLGTDTELADHSIYDLLGGAAFKTHALSVMLGALTATDNLKGILGAYTTAANLKAAIDAINGYVAAITAAGPTNTQMNTAIALCAQISDGWDATLASILDNFSAARIGYLDNIDTKAMGRLQVAVATWDGHFGNGGGGTDTLFTVVDQDIIVEALIVKMTTVDLTDDDWDGLSIQDDYGTTPHTFIAAADGVKANLDVNAQLAWTGAVLVDSGQHITATAITADANEDAKIIVIIKYRAVVDGGYVT